MRVSRAQAEENRQRVIEVASRLFRENGFDGVGLATLMKGAGLTHGGFYKQFASKEDLEAKALAQAFEETLTHWKAALERGSEAPLEALTGFYLTDAHRGALAEGCALAALGSDAARQGKEIRSVYEQGVEGFLRVLEQAEQQRMDGGLSPEEARSRALAMLSTMVGALLLSRAVESEDLSRAFLLAAAENVVKGTE